MGMTRLERASGRVSFAPSEGSIDAGQGKPGPYYAGGAGRISGDVAGMVRSQGALSSPEIKARPENQSPA